MQTLSRKQTSKLVTLCTLVIAYEKKKKKPDHKIECFMKYLYRSV